tara:strand:- start:979 stop:1629 length:651 start_codon:yes stop_codon:yes gene_type:complete
MDLSEKEEKTKNVISGLCDELCVVKLSPHPLKRAILWCSLGFAYIGVCLYMTRIRNDILDKLVDFSFVFELMLTLSMAVSAGFCAFWLCVPDMRGQKWMISVPTTLFAVLAAWIGLQTALLSYEFPDIHWHTCYKEAIMFGVIPAIAIIVLSLKGKTTHPALLSIMNALAIGGFGYAAQRLSCGSDHIGHICAYHVFPYFLFALFCVFIIRKIYRW